MPGEIKQPARKADNSSRFLSQRVYPPRPTPPDAAVAQASGCYDKPTYKLSVLAQSE